MNETTEVAHEEGSVLDDLSHDLIIGLVNLIGPYYDLFADAVLASRRALCTDVSQLDALTCAVQNSSALLPIIGQHICTKSNSC
jgi:hypothetical protein